MDRHYLVYPNPFKDDITIRQELLGEYKLIIFNIEGKLVTQIENIKNVKFTLKSRHLEKGTYILQVDNGIQTKEFKIIKTE
ncbi:MAG: T9SS type A sorting domain-containing protein [Bacteroidales bacterium]|nr:T9SS type A sorting domain-containing protein [Bacteroidales bacterium]